MTICSKGGGLNALKNLTQSLTYSGQLLNISTLLTYINWYFFVCVPEALVATRPSNVNETSRFPAGPIKKSSGAYCLVTTRFFMIELT